MNRRRTAHPAALLISMTVVYHVLDGVRSLYLFGRFGPAELDAFYGAYIILEAAVNAAMLTALGAVMMPALADAAKEGGEELAERFGTTILLLASGALSALAVAGVVLAPKILLLYGFAPSPQSVLTARLIFAVLPFFAVEKIGRIVLEHRQQFGPPVAASLVIRIVFLIVVFALASAWGVVSTGAASLAAAVVTVAFLTVAFFAAGARMRRPLPLNHGLLKRAGRLVVPLGIAGFFAQARFVDGVFASYLGAGQMSLLQLGLTVYSVPIALFCVSVGTAAFPRMCEAAAAGDRAKLQEHVATSVRRAMYFTLPTMFGVIVLARPLIRVAYERGAFGAHHTVIAASCLAAYSLGLVAAGMRPLLSRAVFAVHHHAWFIGVELVTLVLNVAFNILFAFVLGLGIVGLALSTTVASFVTTWVLWLLVKKSVGTDQMSGLRPALFKMAGCAAFMAAVCWALWVFTRPAHDPGAVMTGLRLAVVILFGAALYFTSTSVVRLEEYADCRRLFDKFVRRKG